MNALHFSKSIYGYRTPEMSLLTPWTFPYTPYQIEANFTAEYGRIPNRDKRNRDRKYTDVCIRNQYSTLTEKYSLIHYVRDKVLHQYAGHESNGLMCFRLVTFDSCFRFLFHLKAEIVWYENTHIVPVWYESWLTFSCREVSWIIRKFLFYKRFFSFFFAL